MSNDSDNQSVSSEDEVEMTEFYATNGIVDYSVVSPANTEKKAAAKAAWKEKRLAKAAAKAAKVVPILPKEVEYDQPDRPRLSPEITVMQPVKKAVVDDGFTVAKQKKHNDAAERRRIIKEASEAGFRYRREDDDETRLYNAKCHLYAQTLDVEEAKLNVLTVINAIFSLNTKKNIYQAYENAKSAAQRYDGANIWSVAAGTVITGGTYIAYKPTPTVGTPIGMALNGFGSAHLRCVEPVCHYVQRFFRLKYPQFPNATCSAKFSAANPTEPKLVVHISFKGEHAKVAPVGNALVPSQVRIMTKPVYKKATTDSPHADLVKDPNYAKLCGEYYTAMSMADTDPVAFEKAKEALDAYAAKVGH